MREAAQISSSPRGCDVVLRGRHGTSRHSHVPDKVSKVVLCDRRNTFASFSEDALHFSWQAQHFGDLHRHFAWQVQHVSCMCRMSILRAGAIFGTLYTLHSTPYTLHLTLYASHFTLDTPHSTLLHFTLDNPRFTLYT